MHGLIEAPANFASHSEINLGPSYADPELRRHFHRHTRSLQVRNLHFNDVVVDPKTRIALRGGEAAYMAPYARREWVDFAVARSAGPRDDRLLGRTAFMGISLFDNYFHWLTECLPAIVGYQADPAFEDGILLLQGENTLRPYIWQSLQLALDKPLPTVFAVGTRQLAVSELVCSTLLDPQTAPSPFVNRMYARMAAAVPGGAARTHRRLYVARTDSTRSPIRNEDKLIALMLRHGIEPVEPGKLSLAEQIAMFRDADLVVGAHGAGLTNVAFCPPGAILYELMPSMMVDRNFCRMAQQLGIHYWSDLFPCQAPAVMTPEALRGVDWQVDLEAVDRRLTAMERSLAVAGGAVTERRITKAAQPALHMTLEPASA